MAEFEKQIAEFQKDINEAAADPTAVSNEQFIKLVGWGVVTDVFIFNTKKVWGGMRTRLSNRLDILPLSCQTTKTVRKAAHDSVKQMILNLRNSIDGLHDKSFATVRNGKPFRSSNGVFENKEFSQLIFDMTSLNQLAVRLSPAMTTWDASQVANIFAQSKDEYVSKSIGSWLSLGSPELGSENEKHFYQVINSCGLN